MGMDLSGPGGEFWWDFFRWHKLLRIALRHGWEPAGTLLPLVETVEFPEEDWDGGYVSNDHQLVTAEDAAALADALERALPTISDTNTLTDAERDQLESVDEAELAASDLRWLSGPDWKTAIREFIIFCRAGGFTIG